MTETEETGKDRTQETPSFGEAMEELEEILRRIEGEEIDIDALAGELQRAAELLDLARGKLRKAEVEVTQIVQTLDSDDEGEEDLPDEDEEGPDGDLGEDDDIPF